MQRDFVAELDALKAELAELRSLVTEKTAEPGKGPLERTGHVVKGAVISKNPHMAAIMSELEDYCGQNNASGRVAYLGLYTSRSADGSSQSVWANNGVDTDSLFTLVEQGTAEKVLACIGSRERLSILTALLQKPMSAAELVEQLGFGSTGQAYHHLKPLLAADLISEDGKRGKYAVIPYRVQGIVMLLCGIRDMIDAQYSSGNWDTGE